MNNMGGNKLLIFIADAITGGLIVYSASSTRMRSLATRAYGKGIH